MKIAIGIACNRQIRPKTVQSLLQMVAHSKYEYEVIVAVEGYTIAENRTYIIVRALRAGCSHVLFIDDDMTFPSDTLDRLLAHEKEIVGAQAYSRMLPLRSHVVHEHGETPKELFDCIHLGTAVMLIDLSVFNKIAKPWFKFTTTDDGLTTMGEDAWFCEQAYRASIKVWCDPTIPVGHIGDYIYGDPELLKQLN